MPGDMRMWSWTQAGILFVALGLALGMRADTCLERDIIVENVEEQYDPSPSQEKVQEGGKAGPAATAVKTAGAVVRGHLPETGAAYRVLAKKAAAGEFPARHKIAEMIQKYARLHHVDPKLVWAVMRRESGFNSQAVSPKGAMGLMQLIPSTAALMGVSEPFNAEQNIAGGVKYLKHCLVRFNNDVILALAAYNAGPDNVIKYNGCPPFAETRAYVANVLKDYSGAAVSFPVNIALDKPRKAEAAAAEKPKSALAWKVPEPRWKVAEPRVKVAAPTFAGKLAPNGSSRGQLARLPGKEQSSAAKLF